MRQPLQKITRIKYKIQPAEKMLKHLRKVLSGTSDLVTEMGAAQAYDIWAGHYDWQPGNLMLDLDQQIFTQLFDNRLIKEGSIADIGCGTGRHWPIMMQGRPKRITGFDVSSGMLDKLKEKFPDADARLIADNYFLDIPDDCFDTLVSTLTVAHIQNLEEALYAWCRILKPVSEIILTDFHPEMLVSGGKRTFRHLHQTVAVQNYVHMVGTISSILASFGFTLISEKEIQINESVKHYYEQKNALPVYERFFGMPVIYGLHFKRRYDPR